MRSYGDGSESNRVLDALPLATRRVVGKIRRRICVFKHFRFDPICFLGKRLDGGYETAIRVPLADIGDRARTDARFISDLAIGGCRVLYPVR